MTQYELELIKKIIGRLEKMALDFTAVNAAVSEVQTAVSGVLAKVTTLQSGQENPEDQATLAGIATQLNAIATSLQQVSQ